MPVTEDIVSVSRLRWSLLTFAVSETSSSSSAAVPLSAMRMLLPMISPSDAHMLIERELTKTNESSSVTDSAASVHPSSRPADDDMSVNPNLVERSTASKSVAGEDHHLSTQPMLGAEASEGLGLDDCDKRQSVKTCRVQPDDSEALCVVRQSHPADKRPICSKLDPTADIKKPDDDGLASQCDSKISVYPVTQQCSSVPVDGVIELPLKSSAVAGGCKSLVSSDEINNNCRRRSTSCFRPHKIIGNVKVARGAAVRKSKRCNRGRRYYELMSQGILPHHTSRKRTESQML